MTRRRNLILAGGLVALIGVLSVGQAALQASARPAVEVPLFEVDPFWPKPLPNNWTLGNAIGVGIDSRDHVFIVHRKDTVLPGENGAGVSPAISECCMGAPPIIEFDPDGNVVNAWGGPADGYVWPNSNHGIALDHKDNVWIGGNIGSDSHMLKFTHDGKFLMHIGQPGKGGTPNSNSLEHFGRVAKISFDVPANEAYIADGYGHRRVAVIDMDKGNIKRYWGGYGEKPHDNPLPPYNADSALIRSFRTPVHCAEPTTDGLVYVCDRPNDRIQVFRKDGTFVKEVRIAPKTLGDGSVWDIAFSRDPQQKFMYLADGKNMKIYVMDRQSLTILTSFGDGGRQPGQFFAVHSIATDSKGNIYTTETYEGKRVQKFVYKGLGNITTPNQGVVWPTRGGR
jgi:hypothetical protein